MQTASRPMDQAFLPLAAPATTGAPIPTGTPAALLIPLHDLYLFPNMGKMALICLSLVSYSLALS